MIPPAKTDRGQRISQERACGKLILFGEHFVVYGVPALALPIRSMRSQVSVYRQSLETSLVLETQETPEVQRSAEVLAAEALSLLSLDPHRGWLLQVESSLPIGFGLGSSASFSVALLKALARAGGIALDKQTLNEHAYQLETLVHGTPSGIDNTVVSFERPVWFIKGQTLSFLEYQSTLRLVIACSRHPGSTKEAVRRVGKRREADPKHFDILCKEAEVLSRKGQKAYLRQDRRELGRLLDCNHQLLREIGVSTAELDHLVKVARESGALGAKLSGAGMGGVILALVAEPSQQEVGEALRDAGAREVVFEGGVLL